MKILHDEADILGAPAVTAAFGEGREIGAVPLDASVLDSLEPGDEIDQRTFA